MAHFSQALKTVMARSFGDKIAALAAAAEMHGPEVGRLIRKEAPLTAEKFIKLVSACESNEDKALLSHAAVRDFVGEAEYQARFMRQTAPSEGLRDDDLGGPVFRAHFPINARAEQVLRYLINNVQSDSNIEEGLILFGKFLELPPPLEAPPESPKGSITYKVVVEDKSGSSQRGKTA